MIEAPEARILAAQLNQTVKGKRITTVIAGFTPHKFTFFQGDPSLYEELLAGKVIGESFARGGIVDMTVKDAHVVFTDGVNLRYLEPGEKLPAKHQFLLGFDDESCLVASVRMYGGIIAFGGDGFQGGLYEYYSGSLSKPQVLSDDFSRAYFDEMINADEAQKKSAKAFLATEQAVPGLGNGVLQDILYNARIHPKTKIQDLKPEEKAALYDSVKGTLAEMLSGGGRNSETDLFGNAGRYAPFLSKDTVGENCIRCGDIIMKENYMGGSIYYCAGCQKYVK